MSGLPKYHLSEQRAEVLLGPIRATLGELERRTRHYLDRLELSAEDARRLRAAHAALAAARAEVERLAGESAGAARP